MKEDLLGALDNVVLEFVAMIENSAVRPCRTVLVSDEFLHGVGVLLLFS